MCSKRCAKPVRPGPLVLRADVEPLVDVDDRELPVDVQDDLQAVRKRVLLEDDLRGRVGGSRGRRRLRQSVGGEDGQGREGESGAHSQVHVLLRVGTQFDPPWVAQGYAGAAGGFQPAGGPGGGVRVSGTPGAGWPGTGGTPRAASRESKRLRCRCRSGTGGSPIRARAPCPRPPAATSRASPRAHPREAPGSRRPVESPVAAKSTFVALHRGLERDQGNRLHRTHHRMRGLAAARPFRRARSSRGHPRQVDEGPGRGFLVDAREVTPEALAGGQAALSPALAPRERRDDRRLVAADEERPIDERDGAALFRSSRAAGRTRPPATTGASRRAPSAPRRSGRDRSGPRRERGRTPGRRPRARATWRRSPCRCLRAASAPFPGETGRRRRRPTCGRCRRRPSRRAGVWRSSFQRMTPTVAASAGTRASGSSVRRTPKAPAAGAEQQDRRGGDTENRKRAFHGQKSFLEKSHEARPSAATPKSGRRAVDGEVVDVGEALRRLLARNERHGRPARARPSSEGPSRGRRRPAPRTPSRRRPRSGRARRGSRRRRRSRRSP